MNHKRYEYGVLMQHALVKDFWQKSRNQQTALLGAIVRIEGVLGSRTFAVRFLKDDAETWESNKFCCEQGIIVSVNENFWPFLAAVSSPQERVKLAKNPFRCEQLMQVPVDSVVGFLDFGEVLLGTVKFIGNVKGMGKGFGICLHEKKMNNRCNGSCGGIRYFDCAPGYGVFTTVERIVPQNTSNTTKPQAKTSSTNALLDDFTEKNIAHISINSNDSGTWSGTTEIFDRATEIGLIMTVKEYPELYDENCDNFKNVAQRENAWKAISEMLLMPVEECMRSWKNLWEQYSKELKLIKTASTFQKYESNWDLFKSLSFLEPHIKQRETPIKSSTLNRNLPFSAMDTQEDTEHVINDEKVSKVEEENIDTTEPADHVVVTSHDNQTTFDDSNCVRTESQHFLSDITFGNYIGQYLSELHDPRKKNKLKIDIIQLLHGDDNVLSS